MPLCEGALRRPCVFLVFRGRWFWAGVRGGWFWCAVARWLAHGATRPCALARGAMCCTARWWRAPAAPLALLAVPGGRGYAPLSPDPYPRQAELAGFCALSRACCASRRCFLCWRMVLPVCLCWRMQRPAVCAFAPRWRGEVLTVSAISSSVGLCFPSCLISSMMLSVSCAV